MRSFSLALRLLLGAVWLVAGIQKWRFAGEFRRTLLYTFGFERRVALVVAKCMPVVEVALGISLLGGIAAKIGAMLATLLLAAFSIGVLILHSSGIRSLSCSCFGQTGASESTLSLLVRNAVLLGIAVELCVTPNSLFSVWPRSPFSGDVVPAFVTALGLAVLSLLARRTASLLKNDKTLESTEG